jgi:alcohol dehydrogenase class IV
MQWHKLPKSIYFRRGCLPFALEDLGARKRCLVVTGRFLLESGCVDNLIALLKRQGMKVECFAEVNAEHDHQYEQLLMEWVEFLKRSQEIPASIQAAGVSEPDCLSRLDAVAEKAFDDQCTGANPRMLYGGSVIVV